MKTRCYPYGVQMELYYDGECFIHTNGLYDICLKTMLQPSFYLFFVTFFQKTDENIADFKKKSYFCSQ